MYILKYKKEYGFSLNYQSLVNKCLDIQNLQILKLLIIELKEDNKILDSKIQISISSESIQKICENGAFDFLNYIVFRMLGRIINMHRYISALCDGLSTYYINNNNSLDINKIKWIYEYLSVENKQILKSHISFVK
jgi:hypothetical protein